jgi:hypothetical protein
VTERFPELIKELLEEQSMHGQLNYRCGTRLRAQQRSFIIYATYPSEAATVYRELVALFPWLRSERLMILHTGTIAEEQRVLEVNQWLEGSAVIACATVGFGLVPKLFAIATLTCF